MGKKQAVGMKAARLAAAAGLLPLAACGPQFLRLHDVTRHYAVCGWQGASVLVKYR